MVEEKPAAVVDPTRVTRSTRRTHPAADFRQL